MKTFPTGSIMMALVAVSALRCGSSEPAGAGDSGVDLGAKPKVDAGAHDADRDTHVAKEKTCATATDCRGTAGDVCCALPSTGTREGLCQSASSCQSTGGAQLCGVGAPCADGTTCGEETCVMPGVLVCSGSDFCGGEKPDKDGGREVDASSPEAGSGTGTGTGIGTGFGTGTGTGTGITIPPCNPADCTNTTGVNSTCVNGKCVCEESCSDGVNDWCCPTGTACGGFMGGFICT